MQINLMKLVYIHNVIGIKFYVLKRYESYYYLIILFDLIRQNVIGNQRKTDVLIQITNGFVTALICKDSFKTRDFKLNKFCLFCLFLPIWVGNKVIFI